MHNKYRIQNRDIWYLPLLIGTSCAQSKKAMQEERAIEQENPVESQKEQKDSPEKTTEPEESATEEDKQTEEVPEVLRRLRELTDFIQRCNAITPKDAAEVSVEIAKEVNKELQMLKTVKHMCEEVRSTCRYFVCSCALGAFIVGGIVLGCAWVGTKIWK